MRIRRNQMGDSCTWYCNCTRQCTSSLLARLRCKFEKTPTLEGTLLNTLFRLILDSNSPSRGIRNDTASRPTLPPLRTPLGADRLKDVRAAHLRRCRTVMPRLVAWCLVSFVE